MSAFRAGQVGMVGKLPSRAEYLPVPTSDPSFAAFDAWLSQAMEWASGRPHWEQAFALGAMHGYVFRPPGGPTDSVLAGAVTPSADSAGREFPLALGAPLRLSPELVARPELMPFVLEGLWVAATQALADARGTGQAEQRLSIDADTEVAEAAQLYDQWTGELPVAELWALFGPPLANPAGTLRLLLETIAPFRGVERPETTLSLRLPLGLAGGAALCFWLDIVRRWTGWTATVPSVFWSHDGTSGAALVNLGRPPKDSLAELWMPSGTRDEISDLTTPPDPSIVEALAPLPEAVQAVLAASTQASVAHLLYALGA